MNILIHCSPHDLSQETYVVCSGSGRDVSPLTEFVLPADRPTLAKEIFRAVTSFDCPSPDRIDWELRTAPDGFIKSLQLRDRTTSSCATHENSVAHAHKQYWWRHVCQQLGLPSISVPWEEQPQKFGLGIEYEAHLESVKRTELEAWFQYINRLNYSPMPTVRTHSVLFEGIWCAELEDGSLKILRKPNKDGLNECRKELAFSILANMIDANSFGGSRCFRDGERLVLMAPKLEGTDLRYVSHLEGGYALLNAQVQSGELKQDSLNVAEALAYLGGWSGSIYDLFLAENGILQISCAHRSFYYGAHQTDPIYEVQPFGINKLPRAYSPTLARTLCELNEDRLTRELSPHLTEKEFESVLFRLKLLQSDVSQRL